MHDHPGIYPPLPRREVEPDEKWLFEAIQSDDEFKEAWEFVLTHHLSEREGSAFWHGVNIMYAKLRPEAVSA